MRAEATDSSSSTPPTVRFGGGSGNSTSTEAASAESERPSREEIGTPPTERRETDEEYMQSGSTSMTRTTGRFTLTW